MATDNNKTVLIGVRFRPDIVDRIDEECAEIGIKSRPKWIRDRIHDALGVDPDD